MGSRFLQRILVALAVASAALVIAACDEDEPIQESNDVYEVEIPAGYEELSDDELDAAQGATDDQLDSDLGGDVTFELDNAWAKEREDDFATNINVATEELPSGLTLEEYRADHPRQHRRRRHGDRGGGGGRDAGRGVRADSSTRRRPFRIWT